MSERLQRFLSRSKVCSRRKAEQLIADGRVRVNGGKAVIGMKVDGDIDIVLVDGKQVGRPGRFDYILLHKPPGVLSTRSDRHGRKTVLDLLPFADTYLYPVGRLDLDSSGLILLTNDGALAQRLLHPSFHIEKVYRVRISPALSEEALDVMRKGRIKLDGRRIQPVGIVRLTNAASGDWYEVRLHEGRKRHIRRIVALCGARVEQLVRIRMGTLTIRGLVQGRWRRLTTEEVRALWADCGQRDEQ